MLTTTTTTTTTCRCRCCSYCCLVVGLQAGQGLPAPLRILAGVADGAALALVSYLNSRYHQMR
jgi:hypothetical protein